jgi:hypothetical protein
MAALNAILLAAENDGERAGHEIVEEKVLCEALGLVLGHYAGSPVENALELLGAAARSKGKSQSLAQGFCVEPQAGLGLEQVRYAVHHEEPCGEASRLSSTPTMATRTTQVFLGQPAEGRGLGERPISFAVAALRAD